jgi:hypothetical protein
MKSAEQIEQSLRKLALETDAPRRERTLHDLVEAHTQRKPQAAGLRNAGRTIMRQRSFRIAAMVALVVLLVGAFSLSTGSVARSQTQHAVNATLTWLKSMIVGGPVEPAPEPSPGAKGGSEQMPAPHGRAVTCVARFFKVSEAQQDLWRSLEDQAIELARVSIDPEVYCVTLSREQTQWFDTTVTLPCLAAPRVTILEGHSGAICVTDMTPESPRGLALAWQPTVSDDGQEIVSTISFHDGRHGFEIPSATTEPGGTVLIRAKGIFPDTEPGAAGATEILMRMQVDAAR